MKAYWTETDIRNVSNEAELNALMEEVRENMGPTMLFLEHVNGRTLAIGIGGIETVLAFFESDGTSFHSIGDTRRSGVVKFWCRDQIDDFLMEMAVPEANGVDAARRFLASGQRPSNITWEADW